MNTPITETALSRRVTNALCRAGLFTVGAVIEYHNAHDIKTLKSIGTDAIKEINTIILEPNGFGIHLKQSRVKKREPCSESFQKAHKDECETPATRRNT